MDFESITIPLLQFYHFLWVNGTDLVVHFLFTVLQCLYLYDYIYADLELHIASAFLEKWGGPLRIYVGPAAQVGQHKTEKR